jgi:hypothetical protein
MCSSEILMQSLSTTVIKRIKDEVFTQNTLQNIETNIIHVMPTNISMYNLFYFRTTMFEGRNQNMGVTMEK